jgi:hypothetical protein
MDSGRVLELVTPVLAPGWLATAYDAVLRGTHVPDALIRDGLGKGFRWAAARIRRFGLIKPDMNGSDFLEIGCMTQ